ncbi:MAG TPA: hypothetical protein PLP05_05400 [Sedimentisphaerales bacterium]|nr:hypothetical protein [Sedimentisphaerales bacterium]
MELIPVKRWAHHVEMLRDRDQSLWMNNVIKGSIFWILSIFTALCIAILVAIAFFYE